jgi:hypothetical protein
MEIPEFIPSLTDFKNLVNVDNFSQVDIDLQNRTSSTVGYDNFEHYLEFQYFIYMNLFNLKEFANEIENKYKVQNKIKGDFLSIALKHIDYSFEEELEPIFARVQKLPSDIQTRLINFEDTLRKLFIKLMLANIAENDSLKDIIKSTFNDLANQYSLSKPDVKQFALDAISYLDGVSFNSTNRLILEATSNNYYFPKQVSVLQQLHDQLFLGEYIEKNDDFINVFQSKIKPPNMPGILWIQKTPKLFYLLYRLNDNREFFLGQRINLIAHQLFIFKREKTSDNIRASYNKIASQIRDEFYIEKNMPKLKQILDQLL